MMKMIVASVKDLGTLKDIDLKTYHYPLAQDAWTYALVDSPCTVYLVNYSRKAVAYAVVEPSPCNEKNLRLQRCGVLRDFRGFGVAKFILRDVSQTAKDMLMTRVEVLIPEVHCLPGDPDDVSLWLKFQGFRAASIIKNCFDMYGEDYDGFLFERSVI